MNHFIFMISHMIEEKLKRSIENEIKLLRELLTNLLMEASSLVSRDRKLWNGVMQDRYVIIEKIKYIRFERGPFEEELLNPSCEISLLTDQLFALMVKIQEEKSRNHHLELQHLVAIPASVVYPRRLGCSSEKKNTLMTLP